MSSLKSLKNRIKVVKSTQKITKAMKMVAASRLRRTKEKAERMYPYAKKLGELIKTLLASVEGSVDLKLLSGSKSDTAHLVIIFTSDRGLCGAFNNSIVKLARRDISALVSSGKAVDVICIGKKGYELLKRKNVGSAVRLAAFKPSDKVTLSDIGAFTDEIISMFEDGKFDVCSVYYSKFYSAVKQVPESIRLIPLDISNVEDKNNNQNALLSTTQYEVEPNPAMILEHLIPKDIAVQLYNILLQSLASEYGARMTAMENATRNSGEMLKKLTLKYNRTRQAHITRELIEIISGAEAA